MIRKYAALFFSAALVISAYGCGKKDSSDIAGNITKEFSESSSTEKSFSFDTDSNVSSLDISEDIGNITINYSDSDTAGLSLICKSFADEKSDCQEILEHISAKADVNGGKLVVSFVDSDSDEDFSQWLSDNLPDSRIELDAQLNVPTSITDFTAKVNVGNISLIGLKGAFSAYADVGNITCSDLEVSGSSALGCNTGNVELNKNVYTSDISVNIYTGNTTFTLPEEGSGNAEIQLSSKTGRIHIITDEKKHSVTDEKKEENSHAISISAQNCSIEALVETGKITIDQEEQ
ncbi:MAG TPA: hypothetical protein P5191_12850 [Ruminococcus sp.]|nr:hypothetical protein [Ruminococcus sp.]